MHGWIRIRVRLIIGCHRYDSVGMLVVYFFDASFPSLPASVFTLFVLLVRMCKRCFEFASRSAGVPLALAIEAAAFDDAAGPAGLELRVSALDWTPSLLVTALVSVTSISMQSNLDGEGEGEDEEEDDDDPFSSTEPGNAPAPVPVPTAAAELGVAVVVARRLDGESDEARCWLTT